MEMAMYSINNLRMMEVIDVNSGSKLGYIKDIKIDCEAHRIISILIPVQRTSWFNKFDAVEIEWSKVKKVGVDVILVEVEDMLRDEE
jgi:YlmC/YmxH family sporulation protein